MTSLNQLPEHAIPALNGNNAPILDEDVFQDMEVIGQVPAGAPFLEFPSDIQPDWALGLVNFQAIACCAGWSIGRTWGYYT